MIQAVPFNCSLSSFVGESIQTPRLVSFSPRSGLICCSGSRNNAYIPKLEPFSRTNLDRLVQEPPMIQKSENQIADYCVTLEGEESYSCWEAYFELKYLEKEAPKAEVERLIIEAGGVKTLIKHVHGVAAIHKSKKECIDTPELVNNANINTNVKEPESNPCPIPDGLPKTNEELEEEESARMPDSPFTRMLRARGKHPAWYTPAPDHETD